MWIVYILQCCDGSYYTGITNNLENRIRVHNLGKGSKYTRVRLPVKLIASISVCDRSKASRIEYLVKKKNRKDKVNFLLYEASQP